MFRVQSSLLNALPGVRYHFGTIANPREHAFDLDSIGPLQWKQVHGISIAEITSAGQSVGDVDGFYTERPISLEVVTADCLPVLFSRRDGKKVGAVHAGWRGLYGGILYEFQKMILKQGENPKNWVAVIGPSNRACCYEVEGELIEKFTKLFREISDNEISPSFRKLDLARIAEKSLLRMGFSEVEVLPH